MYYTYYKHKANFIATSKIGMYVHVCATIWTKYQLSITVLIQVYVFTNNPLIMETLKVLKY